MIDLVIPAYKPGRDLVTLINKIKNQTLPINKIIIMNTEEAYWEEFLKKYEKEFSKENVEVYHVLREEFDHGNTRNEGISHSDAEYILLMTQDAVPGDEYLVEKLYKAFQNPKVAVSYARQLPKKDCREAEKFTRSFNYPENSSLKSQKDIDKLGIKTYFCSNVCAMYRREIYDKFGGFTKKTIFNEDMIFAGTVVKSGYYIAYEADAIVVHSHNYGNMEQLRRNFDLGVSQKEHPEIFDGIKSESEGIRLVKKTAAHLWKNKCKMQILPMIVQSGFKYIGYKLGKNYTKLSKRVVLKCSMNKSYWQ